MRFVAKQIIIIVSTVTCLVACNNHSANWETLNTIETIIDQNPDSALNLLNDINCDTLSEDNKMYHHFLTVKAMDKAYIVHKSDSLISLAYDYFQSHNTERLPEVVYYCGRVNNDLGDYPTALNFYQNALDMLPTDTENQKLRGAVLSQTGRLLNKLRLYEQAIPYLNDVIKIDSTTNDKKNLMYDLQLLGAINLHAKKYTDAESLFTQAKSIAINQSSIDVARMDVYLAAIKYYIGDLDSSLILIRPTISKLHHIDKFMGLSYAAHIYLKSGILDTAFIYATELIQNKESYNKATGYQTLLSPKLRGFISQDSLHYIVTEYRWLLENSLNKNESQAALIQNSYYNYQKHERERIKAENRNKELQMWIIGGLILICALAVVILLLKYRNKSQRLQLQEAINNIATLRQILSNPNQDNVLNKQLPSEADIDNLRARLREELLLIIENQQSIDTPKSIEESDVLRILNQYIKEGKIIANENSLWNDIENAVLKCSPDFKYRLQLLVGGELKPSDMHLALLIKCGIRPTDISILVGRAKATIAYRRESLGMKVFDRKIDIATIDKIIRYL